MATNPDAGRLDQTGEDAAAQRRERVRRYLTPAGEKARATAVARFDALLVEELYRQAAGPLSRLQDPELTTDSVRVARQAAHARLAAEGGPVPVDWSLFAALLVTLGTVGASIMAGFLHSPWQQGLFGVFVVLGGAGLTLTWTVRRPHPPRPD